MTAAVITLVILYFLKKHKCDSHLHLGINYKRPTEEINKHVVLNAQKIINILQNKLCGKVFNFVSSKLDEAIKNIPFASCKEIQSHIDESMKELPTDIDDELKTLITSIFTELMKGLCDSSGTVNTKVLTSLIKDLYESACYTKW